MSLETIMMKQILPFQSKAVSHRSDTNVFLVKMSSFCLRTSSSEDQPKAVAGEIQGLAPAPTGVPKSFPLSVDSMSHVWQLKQFP